MSVKAIYRGRDKNKSRDMKLVHLAKVKNLSSLSAWVISKYDVRIFLAKHQRGTVERTLIYSDGLHPLIIAICLQITQSRLELNLFCKV